MSASLRRGAGRVLRTLTGVDEDLLDTVPTERSRYTAMGGVVLGTALMAMFSMTAALFFVFDGFHPTVLVFVPVWGAFILCLDRWLMAGAAEPRAGRRLRKLLPRLVLAAVFGVIIAEPLLLGVFHTAIEREINDQRAAEVTAHESELKQCNPVPGTPEFDGPQAKEERCADLRLGVTTDSEARQRELADLQEQAKTLKADTDADDKELARLERLARMECNGTDSDETTGRVGEGPNCERLRKQAAQYRRDQRLDANHRRLTTLNADIQKLTREVADRRGDTARLINEGIAAKTAEFRANQKEIGLLERLGALGTLVERNGYMRAAEWALRLFFVAVDSLPVVVKFLTGVTAYDRVVADRLSGQRRAQRVVAETERRRLVIQEELARYQMNAEHASAVTRVEFDARMRNVDVEMLREEVVNARAEYLLRDDPTMPLAMPSGDAGPTGGPR
ncbi:DUF4407 domain-containing protein [Micromonospora sp. WMMD712]|uniref:DUF4407 domain-containing protein n=1 Tax=Micromonospora sp. WMMD712 TaxID=3016096 RepID=UPI00249B1501|nr:DUF4407 domain-containing protein [Micromonospora sp. WMMD712]WFE59402.1 DUF4407 domain-containing protein [Micromonospora sp. WMMD712]